MSSEASIESNEDFENVPLVRMEDVQPRPRSAASLDEETEVLETCIVDDTEYEECLVEDDDSNIGSMVSIQSEEVVETENSAEMIVPEVLEAVDVTDYVIETTKEEKNKPIKVLSPKVKSPGSWPTLEILPGGVINLGDKNEVMDLHPNVDRDTVQDYGEMVYACAKCSQSFKILMCLVKHVKWHEDEEKKMKQEEIVNDVSKLSNPDHIDCICLHSGKRKITTKTKKRKIPKKS